MKEKHTHTKKIIKQTKKDGKEQGETEAIVVAAKWFCCAFKLDFIQLICQGSLIFKPNLELALSIILKERELYKSKHAVVECRCLYETCYLFWYVHQS